MLNLADALHHDQLQATWTGEDEEYLLAPICSGLDWYRPFTRRGDVPFITASWNMEGLRAYFSPWSQQINLVKLPIRLVLIRLIPLDASVISNLVQSAWGA